MIDLEVPGAMVDGHDGFVAGMVEEKEGGRRELGLLTEKKGEREIDSWREWILSEQKN